MPLTPQPSTPDNASFRSLRCPRVHSLLRLLESFSVRGLAVRYSSPPFAFLYFQAASLVPIPCLAGMVLFPCEQSRG